MTPKSVFVVLLSFSAICPALLAVTPANPEQEYQTARTIALRDAKVREAYDDADRKLEAKILQIDPALAGYVHHRSTSAPSHVAEKGGFHAPKKSESPTKPATATAVASGTTYVVKKGDTLGAIATQYHVKVAALKSANHIVDEKKLIVGQSLNIPSK